jgi:hypothetical protein
MIANSQRIKEECQSHHFMGALTPKQKSFFNLE